METKPAFVIAFAREVIVDAGWGRRGGAAVACQLLFAPRRRRLALPGDPPCNLRIHARQNAVQAADAEQQEPLGRGHQGGEMHLRIAVRSVWTALRAGALEGVDGVCFIFVMGYGKRSAESSPTLQITLKRNRK